MNHIKIIIFTQCILLTVFFFYLMYEFHENKNKMKYYDYLIKSNNISEFCGIMPKNFDKLADIKNDCIDLGCCIFNNITDKCVPSNNIQNNCNVYNNNSFYVSMYFILLFPFLSIDLVWIYYKCKQNKNENLLTKVLLIN
jgi:hypothetical protein